MICNCACEFGAYFDSQDAGWSSLVARQAHNLKAAGSNPAPATNPFESEVIRSSGRFSVALRSKSKRQRGIDGFSGVDDRTNVAFNVRRASSSLMPEKHSNISDAGRILIGTASWSDPGFLERWYPKGMPANERLAWYADQFQVVEVNSTFYFVPDPRMVERWCRCTPMALSSI